MRAWPSSRFAFEAAHGRHRPRRRGRERGAPARQRAPRRGPDGARRPDGAGRRSRGRDRAAPRRGPPARPGPRADLGVAQRRIGVVARVSSTRRSCGVRHVGERLLDEPERLLGGVRAWSAAGAASIEKRAGPLGVARRRARAGRSAAGRQAGGSPPSSRRSTTARWTCRRRACESSLVEKSRTCSWVNVKSGLARRMLQQEPGPAAGPSASASGRVVAGRSPRRRRSCRRRRPSATRSRSRDRTGSPEIAQAEASARGPRHRRARLVSGRQACGAALDERPDGRRHEPGGIPAEPPHAVDELDHAGFAVRPGELLDDERHALRLAVHAATEAGSTGPPSTRLSSSPVSSWPKRPGRSRRTRPIRSMSATRLTASVTAANSSGRMVRNRKIGRSASLGRRSEGAGGCRRRPTGRRR